MALEPNIAPEGPPTKVGESSGDLAAGLFCSWAILAALYERTHTGQGRQILIRRRAREWSIPRRAPWSRTPASGNGAAL